MILHTDISGQGKPLVLIHGLFGSLENLGVIARTMATQFQTINIDLPNHGRSPWTEQFDYPSMAKAIAETLTELKITSAYVLGHSMGGKTAMQLAFDYPQLVEKLILADISPVPSQARHLRILDGLNAVEQQKIQDRRQADQVLSEFVDEPGVRAFLLKSLQKDEQGLRWRFNVKTLTSHYAEVIAAPSTNHSYDGPTLFIKGGDSDYILPEHQTEILRLFPKARAKIIHGTGHWLHAEKPVAFCKICSDFLLS